MSEPTTKRACEYCGQAVLIGTGQTLCQLKDAGVNRFDCCIFFVRRTEYPDHPKGHRCDECRDGRLQTNGLIRCATHRMPMSPRCYCPAYLPKEVTNV